MADETREQPTTGADAPARSGLGPLAWMVLFVAMVHAAWWLFGDMVVAHGNLVDSDGYARLLRVRRLLESGAWFDSSLPRANWPDGGSLHWTRLFDVLLIGLGLPLVPALGQAKALYLSGVVISPLLHLAAAAALAWAARPLIGREGGLVAGALTAVQFGVLGYATVGHADHHMLHGLIAVVAFGATVRALGGHESADRHAVAAGAVLAMGLWVGIEALVTAGLCLGALGLRWVLADSDAANRWAERNLRAALALLAGLAAVLLVERGPAGLGDVGYDRVSIVHLTLAGMIAAFWAVVAGLARRGIPAGRDGRLVAGLAGAAVAAAELGFLFPRVFVNPLKDFDPVILAIFESVAEYAPIADVPHFLLYLGAAVVGLPWAAWRLRREWPGPDAYPWLLLVALALITVLFAMSWIRWSMYAGLFTVVAVADLALWVDAACDRRFAGTARIAVKTAAVVTIAVGPLVLGVAAVYATAERPAEATETAAAEEDDPRPCPVQALARVLELPPWNARPRAILASANFGAELLYRTRHRVTATIHHSNAAGILDSVRILGGADEAAVLKLIRKREIDLIVICSGSGDDGYFVEGGGEAILYKRLERGDLPAWLAERALPEGLAGRFRLFEVRPPS
ncbi:MAG: hypothetical protein ACE5GT_05910 [Rhodospirillales bacterium]